MLHGSLSPAVGQVLTYAMGLFRTITAVKPIKLMPGSPSVLATLEYLVSRRLRVRFSAIFWQPPPMGSWKLNTDGSSLGNPGPAGGGYVVRGPHSEIIHAAAVFLGTATSLFSEIRALLLGLQWCAEQGCPMLYIECDSKVLVDLLSHKSTWPWRFQEDLQEIESIMRPGFQLRHIYRECNAVADSLARLASSSTHSTMFYSLSLPSHIKGLVALDSHSFPYLRHRIQ